MTAVELLMFLYYLKGNFSSSWKRIYTQSIRHSQGFQGLTLGAHGNSPNLAGEVLIIPRSPPVYDVSARANCMMFTRFWHHWRIFVQESAVGSTWLWHVAEAR